MPFVYCTPHYPSSVICSRSLTTSFVISLVISLQCNVLEKIWHFWNTFYHHFFSENSLTWTIWNTSFVTNLPKSDMISTNDSFLLNCSCFLMYLSLPTLSSTDSQPHWKHLYQVNCKNSTNLNWLFIHTRFIRTLLQYFYYTWVLLSYLSIFT